MKYKEFYRRNLPHIQPEDAVFFITYRLYFELPFEYKIKINTMKSEFLKRINLLSAKQRKIEMYKFEIDLFEFDDNNIGKFKNSPFWLREKKIAKLVKDSLFWGVQKYYDLFAFCIMPNHVHLLIRPLIENNKPYPLQKIMYDHKHFTAREANNVLKRKGNFWLDEHYDHYIRNEKEFNNILNYVYLNPVNANLVNNPEDWAHTYLNDELL